MKYIRLCRVSTNSDASTRLRPLKIGRGWSRIPGSCEKSSGIGCLVGDFEPDTGQQEAFFFQDPTEKIDFSGSWLGRF